MRHIIKMVKKILKKVLAQFSFIRSWKNYFWLRKRQQKTIGRLTSIRNKHAGETIFIVASGPSLENTDLKLLNGKTIITIQFSYKSVESISPAAHYWLVSDRNRIKQLSKVDRSSFTASFFTPSDFKSKNLKVQFDSTDIVLAPKIILRGIMPKALINNEGFEDDLEQGIERAGTKSIFQAIQIAAYLGASKIVLLGADFGDIDGKHHFDANIPISKTRSLGINPYESQYDNQIKPALQRYLEILNHRKVVLLNASYSTREDVLPKEELKNLA